MSHAKFCGFEQGMNYSEYFGGKFALLSTPSIGALGFGAVTGSFLALGAGALFLTVPMVHSVYFTRRVPEFAYAVVSRQDLILHETWGSGIHKSLPGDELFVIKTNPIPLPVKVKRQLTDGREVVVELQITVTPHPRIANEDGKNAYGAWVIEDDEAHAQAHVRDAIVKPLSGILTNVIGTCSSDELDEFNLGLALLVEGEVALRRAPHHLAGSGKLPPMIVEGAKRKILKWYHVNHEAIREFLDEADEAFEAALEVGNDEGAGHYLSNHEIHVGCVFNAAEIVAISYDAESSAAKKSAYIAQQNAAGVKPTMDGIKEGAQGLIAQGVSADTAAMLAAGAARVQGVTVDGKVYSGNAGGDLKKAAVLGDAAGDAMGGKKP